MRFEPPLPSWKQQAIERLGFGNLNKVGLLFPYVFWDDTVDYFGCIPEKSEDRCHHTHHDIALCTLSLLTPPFPSSCRGESFLFNNLHRCMGQPILLALVAGSAAIMHEHRPDAEIVQRTMAILKRVRRHIQSRPSCTAANLRARATGLSESSVAIEGSRHPVGHR